jgi:hypothetical protein
MDFSTRCLGSGYIFRFILAQYAYFPLFFAEKRYKLSNFATEIEIVYKVHTRLIINEKE